MEALLPSPLDPQPSLVPLYVRLHRSPPVVELGGLWRAQIHQGRDEQVSVELALLVAPTARHRLGLAPVTVRFARDTELLPRSGSLPPLLFRHALRHLLGPPAGVSLADELVAAPAQPVQVLVGPEAPV